MQVAAFSKAANMTVEKVVRAFSYAITERIVMKSPVDTGMFRSSWQVGIGAPPGGTATGNPLAQAKGALASWKFTPNSAPIWIVNNLPYGMRLEFGWSKQAPAGMVRTTVLEAEQIMKKVIQGV